MTSIPNRCKDDTVICSDFSAPLIKGASVTNKMRVGGDSDMESRRKLVSCKGKYSSQFADEPTTGINEMGKVMLSCADMQ
ncbi:MAG: hypothetical protein QXO76_09625, partial [Thermoproteota archaeon]